MKRIRLSLFALVIAAMVSGCDAPMPTAVDCDDPTMGSDNRC